MPASIHQEIVFAAKPERVYAALTETEKFSAFTGGAPAEISREAGGAFTCFGGRIGGRNVELVPGKRIVQAWRAGTWAEGVYSVARFELKREGDGTRLVFDHAGFPEAEGQHLEAGWAAMYWEPLRKYLA